VVTGDARLTQKPLAKTVIDQGGDYTLIVKRNQPILYDDMRPIRRKRLVADYPHAAQTVICIATASKERHPLQASTALAEYWTGPLGASFRLAERGDNKKDRASRRASCVLGH